VDLPGAIRSELEGLEVWMLGTCTMHDESLYSHRRTGTAQRIATVAWVA
jgi:copper oxidase (laccase) domain-containing protein